MSTTPFKLNTEDISSFLKETFLTASRHAIDLIKSITESETKSKNTVGGLVLIIFGGYVYYRHKHSFWSRRKIKGPRPIPILGNLLSFYLRPRQNIELDWARQYGKLYGYYVGKQPILVCADAHVLKKICIKDFDKFPNHFFMGVLNKYQKHFLLLQKDDHWRGMRALLTPTFTSGKIKIIHKLLDSCSNDLLEDYREQIEKSGQDSAVVDSRKLFGSFSLSSAMASFYGITFDRVKSEDDAEAKVKTRESFAIRIRQAFQPDILRFLLANTLPPSILEKLNLPIVAESRWYFFAKRAASIIEHRRSSPQQYNDYLHLLLEAKADSKSEIGENDKHEEHHALISPDNETITQVSRKKLRLTEEEVICQVMMLMMVATETTATLLTHTIYLLAYHQEIQQTLHEELMKIKTEENKFEYDQLTSCVYLDCVISETLRLMPPALYMDRVALEDYYIEEYGVNIPKGTIVNLAYYAIHMNSEYWPSPEKFDLERFKPENKEKIIPGSYSPFGIGPRHCIGFRFALTEAKLGLAKLLTEFSFHQAPGVKYPPEPKSIFILSEHKNLSVLVKQRN